MLIEAALRCLAREGIQGFTVDRICKEAGVSRGLINHYFDGKDGLLIELYRDSLYDHVSTRVEKAAAMTGGQDGEPASALEAIVDVTLDPQVFSRETLKVWLALWGEIASNPTLRRAHHALYGPYRDTIAREIRRTAQARRIEIDAERMAAGYLALVDGLWLEWCLDESIVDLAGARAIAIDFLEARLGPIGQD